MVNRDGKAGAEIEITPEMTETGVSELSVKNEMIRGVVQYASARERRDSIQDEIEAAPKVEHEFRVGDEVSWLDDAGGIVNWKIVAILPAPQQ